MKRRLFDITADLQALDDLLYETGGDVTDPTAERAIDAWMAELGGDLETKVDNYAALIRELEARAELRKAEAARLSKRAKVDANTAKGLADRLKLALEQLGIDKPIETPRFRVGVVNNGGKLPLVVDKVITSDEDIPDRFCKVIPAQIELDKDALRKALEAGEDLDGFAHLGPRGTRLSIR